MNFKITDIYTDFNRYEETLLSISDYLVNTLHEYKNCENEIADWQKVSEGIQKVYNYIINDLDSLDNLDINKRLPSFVDNLKWLLGYLDKLESLKKILVQKSGELYDFVMNMINLPACNKELLKKQLGMVGSNYYDVFVTERLDSIKLAWNVFASEAEESYYA